MEQGDIDKTSSLAWSRVIATRPAANHDAMHYVIPCGRLEVHGAGLMLSEIMYD